MGVLYYAALKEIRVFFPSQASLSWPFQEKHGIAIHPTMRPIDPRKKPPASPHVRCLPSNAPMSPKKTDGSNGTAKDINNATAKDINDKMSAVFAVFSDSSYSPLSCCFRALTAFIIATTPSGGKNRVATIDQAKSPLKSGFFSYICIN